MIEWKILKRKMIGIYNANCYKNIEPDLDKMLGLAYEWYKNEKIITNEKIEVFCSNIDSILKQEIELRKKDSSEKAIWLTR